MQHMFFDFKYFSEMYCVLDHAWRNTKPKYLNGDIVPQYATEEFITMSLQHQMRAYNQIMKFKQSSDQQFAQQQFAQQHTSSQNFDPNFFEQQQTLLQQHNYQSNNPPLYPNLSSQP